MSHSQLPVLFLLTIESFSIFGCKEYNQSDFGIDHLVMSMCRVVSCVVGRQLFAMTSACSWQNSVSLCPPSFCTPRPNFPVTAGILTSYFCTANKAGGGDGIPDEVFQILKDAAIKVLHSICQQIWKIQQWPQNWKGQFSFQLQRKAKPKNVQTTTQLYSSHTLAK